ncbi:MAG: methyltransferase domain-containing protein [Oscillospiraceae bacterium]|nr:methyltransferase domain-containing protein [Oscillospiraceae bacterium]
MQSHPGGEAHTRRMLELAALPPGARVLDLGAGAGETVALLRALGCEARGIDLAPRSPLVERGDLLRTGLPAGSFDAVLSQCAFFLSGDQPAALREAARLLAPGGRLLLSDLFFEDPVPLLKQAGFRLLRSEDLTPLWRDYYLEALWREEAPCCEIPRGKCSYRLLIARKEEQNGSL